MAKKDKTPTDDPFGGPIDLGGMMGGSIDLGGDFDPADALRNIPETPDPLGNVEYTGDLSTDAALELTALEEGYRARAKQEADRFREATDSEFWLAVVFKTREDKEDFLARYKLGEFGDKYITAPDLERRVRPVKA